MSRTEPPRQSVLGAIIRRQRELAELSMRQVAAAAGISNPYLSQIERGLRAPSDAVLTAIADTLDLTLDQMFLEAGFVDSTDEADDDEALLAAIDKSRQLTAPQRRAMREMYRAFVDANAVRRHRPPSG